MAYQGDLEFLQHWEARDTGSIDMILEWIKDYAVEVLLEESKFAKMVKRGGEIPTLEPSWVTQYPFPRQVKAQVITGDGGTTYTVTFSGKFNGDTLTTDLLKQIISKNSRIQKTYAGLPVQWIISDSAIDGLTLDCKPFGGTTPHVDGSATVYDLGSPPDKDTNDFEQPQGLPRRIDHTFTQRYRRRVEITDTDRNIRDKVIKDPFQRKVEANIKDMAHEVAWDLINARPQTIDGGTTWLSGYDIEDPTMAGLLWWAQVKGKALDSNTDVFVDCSAAPFTPFMCWDLAHHLRTDRLTNFGDGKWILLMHPTTMRYTQFWEEEYRRTDPKRTTVGFSNTAIHAEGIDIEFVDDLKCPQEIVFLVDVTDLEYGPFKGAAMRRKDVSTGGWYTQSIIGQHLYGLIPENYAEIGVLYNLKKFSSA